MSFAFGAAVGGANSKSAGTDPAMNPTSAISAGTVVVVQAVSDNNSGTTGATSDHSVFDSQGNTWSKIAEVSYGGSGAGTGVTVSAWVCQLLTSLATTDTITLHVPSGVAAKALGAATYTIASGHVWEVSGTPLTRTDAAAASPTSLQLTGMNLREHLFIGISGIDGPTTDTYVTAASYLASANRGTSGGAANTNVWGHQARNIQTSTTSPAYQPSDSTESVNWATILFALREISIISRSVASTGATITTSLTAVYASGGGAPPPPPPPPTPPPPVRVRVSGRVGCSEYQVYVYPRGLGTRMVGSYDFPGWTSLAWEWRLGDKSQATLTLANLATAGERCLGTFAATRKWQHELVIIRKDDGRIWSGPVTGRATQGGSGIVTAYSLDVWLERRDLLASYPQPQVPVAVELADAYADRWHDAIDRQNDMGYQLVKTGRTGILLALQASKRVEHVIMRDAAGPLLDAGLEVVTIDRTTQIGPPTGIKIGRQLLDDHITAFPDIGDDGLSQGNRYGVIAQGAQNLGGNQSPPYAEANRNDLIRRDGELVVVESNSGVATSADAQTLADQRIGMYGDVQPQIASVILRDTAPFPLTQLIPGRLMDVRLYQAPIPVHGLYRITRVGVTLDGQAGEVLTVELTYAPDAVVTSVVT